ncbi:hypothetical protein ACR9GP_22760 [Enterobacter ludwigii]
MGWQNPCSGRNINKELVKNPTDTAYPSISMVWLKPDISITLPLKIVYPLLWAIIPGSQPGYEQSAADAHFLGNVRYRCAGSLWKPASGMLADDSCQGIRVLRRCSSVS